MFFLGVTRVVLYFDAETCKRREILTYQVRVGKVLNIGYRDRIGWGFFISDIVGDIGDMRASVSYTHLTLPTIYSV